MISNPTDDPLSPVLRRIDDSAFEISDCGMAIAWLQRLGYRVIPCQHDGEVARLQLLGATAIVRDDRVVRLVFDPGRKAA